MGSVHEELRSSDRNRRSRVARLRYGLHARRLQSIHADAVISAAKLMVHRGEPPGCRLLLLRRNRRYARPVSRRRDHAGPPSGTGAAAKAAFPAEIAKLEQQATAAAKKGEATSLLSAITGNQQGPFGRRRRDQSPEVAAKKSQKQQEAINAAIKRLFADPYAFLEERQGG